MHVLPVTRDQAWKAQVDVPLVRKERMVLQHQETTTHVLHVQPDIPLQAQARLELTNLRARSVRLVIIPAMATHQVPTRAALPAIQATALPTQVLPVIAARHLHHIIALSRLTTMLP